MTTHRSDRDRSSEKDAGRLDEQPTPSSPPSPEWALDALGSLGDGIIILDATPSMVYANPAATRLLGSYRLDADPKDWTEEYGIFHADERTPFAAADLPLTRALGGHPETDIELFIRNAHIPKGVHLSASACPLRDEGGKVRGAVCIFHDVTRRREQQEKLVEGQRQLKAILDNIPDIAWLKDRQGRFIAVNQRLAAAAGKGSEAAVIGLTDFDLWPRELAERYRRDDEDVMLTKRHHRVEEPFVDVAGTVSWIETVKEAILGDNGDVIGSTGISRDITERKRAEEALRVTKEELEHRVSVRTAELAEAQENLVRKERLAVLGQLAGGVAHQIRNPLAAIMNASYVLKRHLQPEQHPNVEDAIRIIHDEVRHANVIITGLLDFARVRAPDRHPASITELVERVLGAEPFPPSIALEVEIDDDLPLLDLDIDQLHGAFLNVVRNAIEAMPDGGSLRVEVKRDVDAIVLSVTDSGPGISPQVRGHLFEPLHSTKPMGIGLGLVTARTFVEAHGGRITHVELPKGTRFEIRLPVP